MLHSLALIRIATVAAFALATTATQAAVFNTYSDEASFLSALQAGAYTETFASQTPSAVPTSLNFSGGTPSIGYTLSSPGDKLYIVPASAGFDKSVGQENLSFPVVVGGFSQPINALGGYFFNTDTSDVPQSGTLALSLIDSGGTYSFGNLTSPTTGPGTFFGFITTAPITSLSYDSATAQRWTSVANLTVGFVAVPEPSEYAAVAGMALGVFALVRRGRKASAAKI